MQVILKVVNIVPLDGLILHERPSVFLVVRDGEAALMVVLTLPGAAVAGG